MQRLLITKQYLLLILSCFLLLPLFTFAETTVTNTVSVSADGNSNNQAAVTTVVNGEIVEDWSDTSSSTITHSSTYTAAVVTNHTEVTADQAVDTEAKRLLLETLIARLQALIQLYVTLNHQ